MRVIVVAILNKNVTTMYHPNTKSCSRCITSVILVCYRTSTISYSMFFKAILSFRFFIKAILKF